MLYPYTHLPEHRIQERVAAMTEAERLSVVRTYVGDRGNRRHRPGRALERGDYRFDILSDYGAFRDLQRHRLLTVEWQDLTPAHGYTMPRAVSDAGGLRHYGRRWTAPPALHGALAGRFGPTEAAYGVALAYRIRYVMQFNAREALHLIELRTSTQGHPGVPQGLPADAPLDPGKGRSSGHRRPHDLPRHRRLRGGRPRTPRRRAARRPTPPTDTDSNLNLIST